MSRRQLQTTHNALVVQAAVPRLRPSSQHLHNDEAMTCPILQILVT
jgi:hypothetical protein